MTQHGSPPEPSVGLLLLGADEARIAEWHPNRVEVLATLDREQREAEEHELVGPSYSHPRGSGEKATAARSSTQRDLYERRIEEHRERFARAAATATAQVVRRREWGLVLVLGDPRRAVPACEQLAARGIDAVRSDLVLDWLRPAALASRLGPAVEEALANTSGSRT